jgi:succinoglycan biosynthesis protein ExoU
MEREQAETKVDVVIAAWNRAATIERAVLSALAQPEVHKAIIVDDGSTDDTAERVERMAGSRPRIELLRLPNNHGPSTARNRGLDLCSAPWVAILDGDDFFLPGRLAKLLTQAGDSDVVADDILQLREEQIGIREAQPVVFGEWFEPRPLDLATFVIGNVSRPGAPRKELGFLKPLIRRTFLERHGLRYDETLRLGEDYALYAKALALGARFLLTPAHGYVAVERGESLSARHSRADLERLRDVDIALAALPGLSPQDRQALKRHYDSVDAKAQWLAVIQAYKARDLASFLAPFARSPRVSLFLLRSLFAEILRRATPTFTGGAD